MEEVGAVAAGHGDQMVDEGGGLGVETQAGRGALELGQEVPELGLGTGGVLRAVAPVRSGAEMMGYASEDPYVPLDPPGCADLMPVERESLGEHIEAGRGHGSAVGVFFLAAVSTVLRTSSRRS